MFMFIVSHLVKQVLLFDEFDSFIRFAVKIILYQSSSANWPLKEDYMNKLIYENHSDHDTCDAKRNTQ